MTLEFLKTMNPNEMLGRMVEELAGWVSGLKSGNCSLLSSCRVMPFNWTDVLVILPARGVSQYSSLSLDISSEFWRSASTDEFLMFSSSRTTLPAG